MTSSSTLFECMSFQLPFPLFTYEFSQSSSIYFAHQVADKKVPAIYEQLHSISGLKPFFLPWSVFITKLSLKTDSLMYAKLLIELLQITEMSYMPQQAPENTLIVKPFEWKPGFLRYDNVWHLNHSSALRCHFFFLQHVYIFPAFKKPLPALLVPQC